MSKPPKSGSLEIGMQRAENKLTNRGTIVSSPARFHLREIQGETKGVVKLEGVLARESLAAIQSSHSFLEELNALVQGLAECRLLLPAWKQ